MPTPTTASMPPDTELDNGCQVVFEALDPNDGSTVAGVAFTAGVIYVDVTRGSAQQLVEGAFMLVPGPHA